jgi:MFS family permease
MQERVPLSDTVKAGRILQLWGWISLALITVIAAVTLIPIQMKGEAVPLFAALGFSCIFLVPCIYLFIGHYVKKQRNWAKIAGLAISIIFLINVPIGTVIGTVTIYYLMSGWHENSSATETSELADRNI